MSKNNNELLVKCVSAKNLIAEITEGKIVNASLRAEIKTSDLETAQHYYLQKYKAFSARDQDFMLILTKNWVLIFLVIAAMLLKGNSFGKPIILIGSLLCGLYYLAFKSKPFESLITSLLLDKEKAKQHKLDLQYYGTHRQINRLDLLYSSRLSFLGDQKLREMISDKRSEFQTKALANSLFSIKNGAFDCVSISALLILELINQKIPLSIEWLLKNPKSKLGNHTFLVANRTEGTLTQIKTWNRDAILLDGWYGICLTVAQILEDENFFCKYPLLDLGDKMLLGKLDCDFPPENFRYFLDKYTNLQYHKKNNRCEDICNQVIPINVPGR